MDNIYSDGVMTLINTLGINQAGAAQVAIALYEERRNSHIVTQHYLTFIEWCKYKLEEAPYDEF